MRIGEKTLGQDVPLASVAEATRAAHPLEFRRPMHHDGGRLNLRLHIVLPTDATTAQPSRLWVTGLRLTRQD
jgi:hypothetical protein